MIVTTWFPIVAFQRKRREKKRIKKKKKKNLGVRFLFSWFTAKAKANEGHERPQFPPLPPPLRRLWGGGKEINLLQANQEKWSITAVRQRKEFFGIFLDFFFFFFLKKVCSKVKAIQHHSTSQVQHKHSTSTAQHQHSTSFCLLLLVTLVHMYIRTSFPSPR